MPAIAQKVRDDKARFYWHLGDYRAIHQIDQDFARIHPQLDMAGYLKSAWPDFIEHQLEPFGVPVFLSLGNHETIEPKSRAEAIQMFAPWVDSSELKSQRLRDNPKARIPKFYYHWIRAGVDLLVSITPVRSNSMMPS